MKPNKNTRKEILLLRGYQSELLQCCAKLRALEKLNNQLTRLVAKI